MTDLIAIVDIGKTNSKLVFVDVRSGCEVFSVKRNNRSVETALGRQLDVAAIEQWLIEAFNTTEHSRDVVAVVPIAHGATAVLLDAEGNLVAAPDYEDPQFESVAEAYARERDSFEHTLSPFLPLGLNLARQMYYLEKQRGDSFNRVAHALLYPQYWAWRFSGVMASEVTSLGCHSDLWLPRAATFSAMAHARGWDRLFPPLRAANDTLATIRPELSSCTGLPATARVICGIHDSNASYLQHLIDLPREQPFVVVSSGTWTVIMANCADLSRLHAGRDMLANVDAFGSPVATARFMGGREYEAIARGAPPSDAQSVQRVIDAGAFALPSFADAGPFPAVRGTLLNANGSSERDRAALATLYVALMSDYVMRLLDARGAVLIDGPLASNPLFASLLAALRPEASVRVQTGSTGVCARAAVHMAGFAAATAESSLARAIDLSQLGEYRRKWLEQLPRPG